MLLSSFIFTVVRKILFVSTFGSKATTARKVLVALTAQVPIWAPTSTKSSPSNGSTSDLNQSSCVGGKFVPLTYQTNPSVVFRPLIQLKWYLGRSKTRAA